VTTFISNAAAGAWLLQTLLTNKESFAESLTMERERERERERVVDNIHSFD
jgi:hypothetical protein